MNKSKPETLLNYRFRIIEPLAEGGFGKTFLARDTFSILNPTCVVKQFAPHSHNRKSFNGALQGFRKEAEILKELGQKSSQIPKLIEYFEENDNFYLVLEHIPGLTIRETINQNGVCSESEVVEFLRGILPVLDLVHRNKIIHRDIKPSNLILRELYSQAVLIDFGSVKQTFQTILSDLGIEPSVIITSQGFTSPEQATGRPISYNSDIYSLGMTAIFMRTGKEPHEFSQDSLGKIFWEEDCDSINSSLTSILNRAIEFCPYDRYSSAKEMLKAIDRAFHNNPNSGTTKKTIALNLNSNSVMQNPKPKISKLRIVIYATLFVGSIFTLLFQSRWNQVQAKQEEKQYQEVLTAYNSGDYESCTSKATDIMATNSLFLKEAEDFSHNCSKIDRAIALQKQGKLTEGIKTIQEIPQDSQAASKGYQELANFIDIPIDAKSADVKQKLGKPTVSKLDRDSWTEVWQEAGYNIDPTQWINRQNTYQIVPDRISMNLVLDCPVRGRGTVHQVEFIFDRSVPLPQIEAVLAKLTDDKDFSSSVTKLKDIYEQKVQLREFNSGVYTGAIERDDSDNIHLYLRETSTLQ